MWGIGTRGYYQYVKDVKTETFLYQLIAGKYQDITRGILQAYNLGIMILAPLGYWDFRLENFFFESHGTCFRQILKNTFGMYHRR